METSSVGVQRTTAVRTRSSAALRVPSHPRSIVIQYLGF